MSAPAVELARPNLAAKRLRVGLIGEYPVAEDRIQEGGVQSVTYALAHALARRPDIECHIVSAMSDTTTDYRQVGALHVHYVRRMRLPRLVSLRLHDVPALRSVIRCLKPDVVHGQAQDRHALAALNSGLPTVITPHGVLFIESRMLKRSPTDVVGGFKQYLVNSMEREVFARARDMIIISRYLPQVYGPMLRARTHFIDNPIGQEFFQIERAPEAGRLLFVGTVVPRKRVPDLVKALGRVLQICERAGRSPAWREPLQLRIAGPLLDPGTEAQVRSAITSAGLERRVVFLGPISQSQLLDEYARAQL
ncbi:MAG TPA: glycosyltransferase, partial [Steroidobacteraceae bacterium]|nr:glycosyltransferase [Steroidobacteraceae bacterium]